MPSNEAGDAGGKWRRAEIVAALVHLYYLGDETFDPAKMPRIEIAKLLGVERTTITRSIKDAQEALGLAEEVKRRLRPYYEARAQRKAESLRRRKKAIVASNQRARERRMMARRERGHR